MFNHEPENYICPFCSLIQGFKNEKVLSVPSDIIYHDDIVTAFIGSHQWPNNHGNVIIIPNEHFENIYDLPPQLNFNIYRLARSLAIVLKAAYQCDGISTRQHNEPAGNQDVWHYHVHVTPRYMDDNFYSSHREVMPVSERAIHAKKIRDKLLKYNQDNPSD